ncbi:GNAT family N-acetyltransferase [Adhaeribacter rhizoryzae]|uniref:GNAT family N-acetyltransferase n=1 Tax=Adhaeribacter rhizoryzae TaxID=2607907 RepID=A0A5M6D1G0_9BACT|nr:GNAT family N-acetyltransferase [Adhaeribacter rhizoryzae]KAA5541153.1 GNAT family N-acetyltransferase [Adhaeribacter rhizoryzae]
MNVHYEIATPAHLSALLDLQEAFYAIDHYPFNHPKAEGVMRHFLQTPALGIIWVIKPAPEAEAIGYLAFTFCYSFEFGGKIAFLDEFYLKENFRGRGLGTQILSYALEQAKALGLQVLHLEAERHNQAGKALYHKFGFRDHDRHLMTKVINSEQEKEK